MPAFPSTLMQFPSVEPIESILAAYAAADKCAADAYAVMMENGMGTNWARTVARQHFERSLSEARTPKITQ